MEFCWKVSGQPPLTEQEQGSLLTVLDESALTRLVTGDGKSTSALQPGSGGTRGNTGNHPFLSR
jgi:hypothetical protein